MAKSLLSIALMIFATSHSFAATSVPIDTTTDAAIHLLPLNISLEGELVIVPLPASTLLDNALAIRSTHIVDDEQPAVIRINTHNLMQHDARLVDFISSVA